MDDTKETGLKKFEFVLKYAERKNLSILIAGDFTDKPRSWHLLPRITSLLRQHNNRIYVVRGQHDSYLRSEASNDGTILGCLEKADLVYILDDKPYRIEGVDIYGCSWGEEIPKVKYENKFNILVIHESIEENSKHYLDAKKFLLKYKDFNLIHCGDIHRRFNINIKERWIINSGPLLRKDASEYNFSFQPGFFVFDTELNTCNLINIPCQEAAEVLTRDHLERETEVNEYLNQFVESMQSQKIDSEDTTIENIKKQMIQFAEDDQEVIDILAETMEDE